MHRKNEVLFNEMDDDLGGEEEREEGGGGGGDDDEALGRLPVVGRLERHEGRDHNKKDGPVGAGVSGANGVAGSGTVVAPSASARGVWNYCIGLVGKVRGDQRKRRKRLLGCYVSTLYLLSFTLPIYLSYLAI